MLTWIFAAIGLYFICLFLPATMLILDKGVVYALGPRDADPEPTGMRGRAVRVARNMAETLPVFLAFAILAMQAGEVAQGALTGAAVYVLARLAYVPLCLSGILGLRTLIWAVSILGLLIMAVALV